MPDPTTRPPALRLIIAWTLVGIPLFWGVSQTVVRALALFE
jgi:hypothetical protein